MTDVDIQAALEKAHGEINGIIRGLHQELNRRVKIELDDYPFQTFKDGEVDSDVRPLQQYVGSLTVQVESVSKFPAGM